MEALVIPFVCLVLGIWSVVAFANPRLRPRLRPLLRERRTAHWPVVAGIVEAFDWQPGAHGKSTVLFLYYSYKVNERFYSGQFSRICDSYDSAYFAWLRWKGLRIPIRYKPAAPSSSFFPEKTWRRDRPAGFDLPPSI
jgi:hypothetical protein